MVADAHPTRSWGNGCLSELGPKGQAILGKDQAISRKRRPEQSRDGGKNRADVGPTKGPGEQRAQEAMEDKEDRDVSFFLHQIIDFIPAHFAPTPAPAQSVFKCTHPPQGSSFSMTNHVI